MQPDPTPEAHSSGGTDASGSAGAAGTALPRGLLSRLSGSFGGGGAAAAAAATQPGLPTQHDLEQPLLPGSAAEEEQHVAHIMERKRWPELRLSSVSTRRLRCGWQPSGLLHATCRLVAAAVSACYRRAPACRLCMAARKLACFVVAHLLPAPSFLPACAAAPPCSPPQQAARGGGPQPHRPRRPDQRPSLPGAGPRPSRRPRRPASRCCRRVAVAAAFRPRSRQPGRRRQPSTLWQPPSTQLC